MIAQNTRRQPVAGLIVSRRRGFAFITHAGSGKAVASGVMARRVGPLLDLVQQHLGPFDWTRDEAGLDALPQETTTAMRAAVRAVEGAGRVR